MNNHLIVPDCDSPIVDNGALVCLIPRARIYDCYICGCRFMCKSNGKFRDTSLRQHLFDIHDTEAAQTKLLCRFCDFIPPPNTTSQQALSIGRHVKREHSHYQTAMEENLRYKCTFAGCKEQYPTANGLASHQKSHKKAAVDITKELKEILPSIRNRRKAVDEKLDVNQTQSQLLSQAPSDSFQPSRDSDVDDNEHEIINISGESLVFSVRDVLDQERLDRLKDPSKWIDDGVILDLMIKRICEKSEDFLVVNPVIWNGPMPTYWRGKKVQDGIRLPTVPKYSAKWKIAFIPTNVDMNHWLLGVLYEHPARFVFFDTFRKGNACLPSRHVIDKWIQIGRLLTNETLAIEEAPPDSYPVQKDGSSCGPLKCMIAERIAANQSTNFPLSLVEEWRKEAFYFLGGVDSNPLSSPTERKDTVIIESNDEKSPVLQKDLDKDLVSSESDPSDDFYSGLAKLISNDPLRQSNEVKIIPKKEEDILDGKKPQKDINNFIQKQPKYKGVQRKSYFNLSQWILNEVDLWKQRGKHWSVFEDLCNNFISLGKLILQHKNEEVEAVARKMSDKLSWEEKVTPGFRSVGVQTEPRRRGNYSKKFKSKSSNNPKSNEHPLFKQYNTNRKATLRKILQEPDERCDIPVRRLQKFFEDAAKGHPINPSEMDQLCSKIPEIEELEEDTWKPISAEKIKDFMKTAPKTSPGADRITYADLKRLDPEGKALEALYLVCLDERRVPVSWKSSETILIYKKGDRSDPSNWRPISLQRTIYKVYSALIAKSFNEMPGVISWHQKGFQQRNGCAENIQLVSEAISKAKSNRSSLSVCFLDLGNAFGSAPHELIFRMMKHFGFPQKAIDVVKDIYHGSTMTVRSRNGRTAPILIEAGVKQGDPMSPVLFEIALELLLRLSNSTFEDFGVLLPGNIKFNTGAYADDLGVLVRSRAMLEQQLKQMFEWTSKILLKFKPSKCAALIIENGQLSNDQTPITTDNGLIRLLKADEHYDYLGRPLGFERRVSPRDIIVKAAHDVSKIRDSALMPSQKLDAIRASIIPRMTYACQTGLPYLKDLDALDRIISEAVKRICRLPEQTASPLLTHGSIDKGGLGILKVRDEYFLQVINTVIKSLINRDPKMREFSLGRLKEITTLYCRSEASVEKVNEYLSGSKEDSMHWLNRSTKTVCSDLTRFRLAIEHFTKKGIVITPSFSAEWELSVQVTVEKLNFNQLFERGRLTILYRNLRKLLGDWHIFELSNTKVSQGKMYADIAASPLSNKFVQDGRFCSAKSFRFVHRARLSLLPLGGTPMGRGLGLDSQCRRCSNAYETVAHVFGTCPMNHGLIVQRHDSVLKVVFEAASKSKYVELEKEPTLMINGVGFKPDLISTNKSSKDVTIVDVTCPIEGETNFLDKKAEKQRKYQPLIQHYAAQGKKATIKTIIVGQLGAYDPENYSSLFSLGIPNYKINNVAREMIHQSILNSLVILNSHLMSTKCKII